MRHRMLHLVLFFLPALMVLIVLGASGGQTSAQIRIRIPRPRPEPVRNPPPASTPSPATGTTRTTQPTTVTPAVPTSPSASELPTGTIDDGFTWFEAVSTEALGHNNIPYSTGWVLKSHVRIFGEYPNRSAIKLVVAKAGKPVATTRCEVDTYRKGPDEVDQSYMWANVCWRKDTATKETGNFDVKVFAVNGDTDEEKLVRTYKMEVRTVHRVPAGQQPGEDPPQYYIPRHAEAPVSFIFLRPSGSIPYFDYGSRPDRSGENHVELYFSLSPSEIGKDLPDGYMRCSVDGKRLSMPGPMPYADQARSHVERNFAVIHTDRLAPQYKRGTEYREEIGFRIVRLSAPLTWGRVRGTNRLALEDYPGNWECSLMNNGEVWRTWRWKIGSDGRPGLHAEQKGNVNLNFNSYLVEMEIPSGGSPLDQRLAPVSATEGFFYGQKWTTPEGRAMAARVPVKGKLWPVPSTAAP